MELTVPGARCPVPGGAILRSRRFGSEVLHHFSRTSHLAPRTLLLAAVISTLWSGAAAAQEGRNEQPRPWFAAASHYAKWVALAGAGGLLAQGALRHRDADREFATLVDRCRTTPRLCDKSESGAYENAEMEALYQRTVRLDHRAREWLLAGEGLLLGSGLMFLVDLIYRDDTPKNIPFTPFTVYARPTQLGLTLRF